MISQVNNLNEIAKSYGQSAIKIMKQIAEYLKVLQAERPELFVDGVLVEDWVQRVQEAPLPPESLPKPEPIVHPNPVTPASASAVSDVLQRVQKAMGEFGENAVDVMNKIADFLAKLQIDRPDLFDNGVLVSDWSIRIQEKPSEPLILPIFDPNLIPEAPTPVVPVLIPHITDPIVVPPVPIDPVVPPVALDKSAMKFELSRIRSALEALSAIIDKLE